MGREIASCQGQHRGRRLLKFTVSGGSERDIEHSKTGFGRYLNMAGRTRTSDIDTAKEMSGYWQKAGFSLKTTTQAGVKVTRPDFFVVRISLLGMEDCARSRLFVEAALKATASPSVRQHLATSMKYVKERLGITGAEKQSKAYVNVAGGTEGSSELLAVVESLKQAGLVASMVPGPLLLATTGGVRAAPTLMPLTTSSGGVVIKELLIKAWAKANSDTYDPDPDLDLPAGKLPKWSSHSLRRLADTTARRHMAESGATEAEIDIYFGWHEKILLRAMQVHYSQMSIRERMLLAKITGYL